MLLWNVSTGALAGVIPEYSSTNNLAFTPDGRSLVAGREDGGVDLWDIGRRVKTAVVQAGTSAGNSAGGVAVSPDGQTIAYNVETGTNTYAVKLWSVASRRVMATVKANGAEGMASVAFSPDGKQLAASGFDGTIRLWYVGNGTPVVLGNFSGHRYPIQHIAFSPDGATLASASNDGTIDLWNTRGPILGGASNGTNSLAFSPDGKTLAISTAVAATSLSPYTACPRRS